MEQKRVRPDKIMITLQEFLVSHHTVLRII